METELKDIEINTAEYPRDVERIQKALANNGYRASVGDCERLWQKYSDSMCASWMSILEEDTDEEIFSHIRSYISN